MSDEKLIHANGRTYAFTNQWDGGTIEAVDLLLKEMNVTDISYSASSS
jgi:hypothetical protein